MNPLLLLGAAGAGAAVPYAFARSGGQRVGLVGGLAGLGLGLAALAFPRYEQPLVLAGVGAMLSSLVVKPHQPGEDVWWAA